MDSYWLDSRSIEVSLQLCSIEQQNARINTTTTTPLTLSGLFTHEGTDSTDKSLLISNFVHKVDPSEV